MLISSCKPQLFGKELCGDGVVNKLSEQKSEIRHDPHTHSTTCPYARGQLSIEGTISWNSKRCPAAKSGKPTVCLGAVRVLKANRIVLRQLTQPYLHVYYRTKFTSEVAAGKGKGTSSYGCKIDAAVPSIISRNNIWKKRGNSVASFLN